MDDNRQDPIISANTSVLDEVSAVNQINQEEVAPHVEKINPFKLLFNKRNKVVLFLLIGVVIVGCFSLFIAFSSLDSEVKKPSPIIDTNKVQRELPTGVQTEARQEEIDKYNEDNLTGQNQPISLENVSKNNVESLDGSFVIESDDIDPASGCGLTDTACMRVKKRIPYDGCAPKDETCLAVKAAKESPSGEVTNLPETEEQKYLKRLKNKDYMDAMSEIIKTRSAAKKELYVERGGVNKFEELKPKDSSDNTSGQSTIEGGILKSDESNIELLVSSGDRMLGSAEIALNSKIQGEAAFTIFGGQFIESRMIGSVKSLEEYVRVELHTWVLPDKRECSIKAIALDKKTTYAAIASEVDYHTLYRYGWWGLGTVLSSIGHAAEKNVGSEVYVSDGTVVESTAKDSEREIKMAVGSLGQEIGKIMQKRIDTPPTVYVDVNETVGIFFMEPVTSSDCKFGGIKNDTTRTFNSAQ